MKNNAVEPIKLITCIVNRGDGETVTELCARARNCATAHGMLLSIPA